MNKKPLWAIWHAIGALTLGALTLGALTLGAAHDNGPYYVVSLFTSIIVCTITIIVILLCTM